MRYHSLFSISFYLKFHIHKKIIVKKIALVYCSLSCVLYIRVSLVYVFDEWRKRKKIRQFKFCIIFIDLLLSLHAS